MIRYNMIPTARRLVEQVVAIKPGENVLLLTDSDRPESITEAIAHAVSSAGGTLAILYMPPHQIGGKEPPPHVGAAIYGSNVVILQTSFDLDHTDAVREALRKGVRLVDMWGWVEEMMVVGGALADYDKEIELAERVATVFPEPLKKTLFLQSGADANEAAVAIARKYTDGFEVASPHISFHGLSDTTRSLTFAGWHAGYGPLNPGSLAMVAPYCYRCPLDQTYPSCEIACLKTSFELIDAQSTSKPAAVLTEPLFSAGGVVDPPPGWLKKLKEMCDERGMLLIVDEEQTGLGKLGTMFGFEEDGIVPDIVTLAKHFGGGVSVSSVTTSPEIEEKVVASEFVVTHSHGDLPAGT